MRKIYFLLLTFFSLALTQQSRAQVNSYVFLPGTTGVLEDMSAGTTQLIGSGSDDGVSAVTNIGFNFTFNSVVYTQFSVNVNGIIRLGSTVITDQWDNTSGTTGFASNGNNPKIAPYFDDVATGTNGWVRYKLVGSAPTQKLVIEWRVTVPRATTGSANSTIQAWLEETTNRVVFVYGAVPAATNGYSIGIAGSSTDFQSVTRSTNTASISAHNGTQTTAISAGTTYTFFPPPTCFPGSLGGGTAEASVTNACANAPITITVTGASIGSGLSYQWETSATGTAGSWVELSTETGQSLTLTQTTASFYRRRMRCQTTDVWSTAVSVGQNPATSCYCPVVFDSDTEPITLVNFANINNATSATVNGTPDLEDFTSIVGNVSKGQTYPITVKGNTAGNFTTHINVYIDWNQDGDFTDTGESYYLGTIVNSTGLDAIQATGNILIPTAALDGTTRMRVIKKFNTQATSCNATGFGQAEDYTLSITTPPCLAPTGISVGSITANSASVSFTATGTAYVEYGPVGFTPGTGAAAGGGTVVSGASAVALAGLAPNTVYDVYVRQDCGGSVFSSNTPGGSFRTLCLTVGTFPYTETFETSSTTRNCWISVAESGSVNWTFGAGGGNGGTTTTAHGGTVNARYFGNGTSSIAKYISPAFDFTGFNPAFGAQLNFWYINQNWLGDQNELRVYYRTSTANSWTLIPGAVYTTNVATWTEVELLLPSSTTGNYQIAFEGEELFGFGIGIDDVTIKAAPTCPRPVNLTATPVSPTSVIVNFTALTNTAYIVEYGPAGFTPGTTSAPGAGGTIALGPTSPITLNGLTANTAYDIYLRRICDINVDYSENVQTSATTLCTATTIPYVQNFESATVPGMPTCTSMQDVNGNSGTAGGGRWVSYNLGTSPATWVSPVTVVRYIYDASVATRGADDWFYTQGLNLTGGTSYRLKFYYKGSDGPTWFEKLEVKYGTLAHNSAMSNLLFTNNNIISNINTAWDSAMVDFTPAATDVYYIGFHAMSDPDQAFLYLDDVSVKVTPLVDVGVTKALIPTNCPSTSAVLSAIINNFNLTDQNFATYPVTITADITGASTANVSTTINTGILAPGQSDTIPLPGVSLVAGDYTAVISTSSPSDPETSNDSYTISFKIDPSPEAPVITPAAPVICFGDSVRLETQFPSPRPAPGTAVFRTGPIGATVPDANVTGINRTLNISGVPAGATIFRMDVKFTFTHTWVADLRINLKAPNGNILNLFNRKGGIFGANLTNTVITSDPSAPALPAAAPPYTGTYRPDAAAVVAGQGPSGFPANVSSFADLFSVPNGDWTLAVADNAAGDVGTLDSITITITYGTLYPDVTWSPVTSLFTNSATTTPYAPTPTSDNPFIYAEPDVNTTYTATAIFRATGCTSSTNVTVALREPAITFTPLPARVCISDTALNLSATPAGGTWAGMGVQGQRFLPPRTGIGTFNIMYTYIDQTNCSNTDTIAVSVEDCPERMIQLTANAVLLYPNPNNGQFRIRINSTLYNKLNMLVFNSAGALVMTQQLSGLTFGREIPFDFTSLPSGTYMVHFNYDGGVRTSTKTFKVVVGR